MGDASFRVLLFWDGDVLAAAAVSSFFWVRRCVRNSNKKICEMVYFEFEVYFDVFQNHSFFT